MHEGQYYVVGVTDKNDLIIWRLGDPIGDGLMMIDMCRKGADPFCAEIANVRAMVSSGWTLVGMDDEAFGEKDYSVHMN